MTARPVRWLAIATHSAIDTDSPQEHRGVAMRLGVVLRNMGPASTRETIAAAARLADATPPIADVWVTDHLAIPPDDSEGSDGRYLDPLATLAFLAATTTPLRPRPSRPPLFVGGQPPFAFRRALAHRGGWMPMGLAPDALAPCVAELRAAAAGRGLPSPEVAVLTSLPLEDLDRTRTLLVRYAEAGAARVIHGARYADAGAFRSMVERLARAGEALPS